MDPYLVLLSVVVVLIVTLIFLIYCGHFVHVYRGSVILRTEPHNLTVTHQKDQGIDTYDCL